MPKRKQPSSLTNVCYASVVSNFDTYWASDYLSKYTDSQSAPMHILGPFDNTPPKFLEKLLEELLNKNKLRKHHLDLLLMPSIKKLRLTKWNGLNTLLSKSHFSVKLKNLTHLDLSMCQIPKKMFHALAEHIPNIESLILKATKCDDIVLSLLGANSPNIRVLDVENCSGVSDVGIYGLILTLNDMELQQSRCLNITDLNTYFTSVTKKGAACALVNLPNLVKFNNQNTLEALEYALGNALAPREYKLENIIVTSSYMNEGWNVTDISLHQLQLATKHLPYVISVNFQQVRISQLVNEPTPSLERNNLAMLSKELVNFQNLTELSINGNPHDNGYSFLQVYDFLKGRGSFLTHLYVGALNFNVNLVGLYCPNLISLELETILDFETLQITQKSPLPFSKLENLMIDCSSTTLNTTASYNILYTYRKCDIEENDMLTLLSNCYGLKKLVLRSIADLKDDFVSNLFLTNQLLHLEHLEITDCLFISDLSISKFVENNQNSLKKLIYTSCRQTNNSNYQKFVKLCRENNYDIDITWK